MPFIERNKNEIEQKIKIVKNILIEKHNIDESGLSVTAIESENNILHLQTNCIKLLVTHSNSYSNELLLPLNENFTKNDLVAFKYLVKKQIAKWQNFP